MNTIQTVIEKFTKLNYEDQKTKLMYMLTQIQESSETFKNLLKYINNSSNVSAEFLTVSYQTIIETANSIHQASQKQFASQMENFKIKMQAIYDQEILEHAQADKILEQIL